MSNPFFIVDVFAETRYTGNPLAVVINTTSFTESIMQTIAAEMDFSETTFITPVPDKDGGYRVRIFTPTHEVAFAGHPILGSAHILRDYMSHEDNNEIKINLNDCQILVTFESYSFNKSISWFRAPPMSLGLTSDPQPVAEALDISLKDLDTKSPIQVISAGTSALIVPLCSLEALRQSKLNLEKYSLLTAKGFPPLIYLFTRETYERKNNLCARFFFESNGVREDPATGNGAAFLGLYLLEHNLLSSSDISIRIEQGHEVQRPSLIHLRAHLLNNEYQIHIGGQVINIVQGNLVQ